MDPTTNAVPSNPDLWKLLKSSSREILVSASACAAVALLSCTLGLYLNKELPQDAAATMITTLFFSSRPVKMAFAAGILVGFSFRSLYRLIQAAAVLILAFVIVFLIAAYASMSPPGLLTFYGCFGAMAGAGLALTKIVHRSRRTAQ